MAENQGEFYKLWTKYKIELDIFWRISCAFLILVIAGYCYYRFMVPFNQRTATDVIYIFTCAASLLGPIALVLTLGAWKGQHNKNILKDMAINFYQLIDELDENLREVDRNLAESYVPSDVEVKINRIKILLSKVKKQGDMIYFLTDSNKFNELKDKYISEAESFFQLLEDSFHGKNNRYSFDDYDAMRSILSEQIAKLIKVD